MGKRSVFGVAPFQPREQLRYNGVRKGAGGADGVGEKSIVFTKRCDKVPENTVKPMSL